MAYDDNPEDLAMLISCEAQARARLPFRDRARHLACVLDTCSDIDDALHIGAEFVGAQGGLQFNEDTGEWS